MKIEYCMCMRDYSSKKNGCQSGFAEVMGISIFSGRHMCMWDNPYKKMAAKNCFAEVIGIYIISGRHCENGLLNTDV